MYYPNGMGGMNDPAAMERLNLSQMGSTMNEVQEMNDLLSNPTGSRI